MWCVHSYNPAQLVYVIVTGFGMLCLSRSWGLAESEREEGRVRGREGGGGGGGGGEERERERELAYVYSLNNMLEYYLSTHMALN